MAGPSGGAGLVLGTLITIVSISPITNHESFTWLILNHGCNHLSSLITHHSSVSCPPTTWLIIVNRQSIPGSIHSPSRVTFNIQSSSPSAAAAAGKGCLHENGEAQTPCHSSEINRKKAIHRSLGTRFSHPELGHRTTGKARGVSEGWTTQRGEDRGKQKAGEGRRRQEKREPKTNANRPAAHAILKPEI